MCPKIGYNLDTFSLTKHMTTWQLSLVYCTFHEWNSSNKYIGITYTNIILTKTKPALMAIVYLVCCPLNDHKAPEQLSHCPPVMVGSIPATQYLVIKHTFTAWSFRSREVISATLMNFGSGPSSQIRPGYNGMFNNSRNTPSARMTVKKELQLK